MHGSDLPWFGNAQDTIPALPPGYTRAHVYRPQAFVGMLGNPVVIVDGVWTGDAKSPVDNRLLPGAVFVVDSAADPMRAWWYQDGRGEETDRTLSLPSTTARTWYLRWGLKPTYGFLELVAEPQALAEIRSLKFSGYVKLDRM
jgi:hypothetical protein